MLIWIRRTIVKALKLCGLYYPVKKISYRISDWDPKKIESRRKDTLFYSQFIRKGDLCFDIGANQGSKTDIFLRLGAKVVCVEPHPDCLKMLHMLFGKNRNVIIVDNALAEKEGAVRLSIAKISTISTLSEKWKTQGRFSKDYKWDTMREVTATTLDSLISKYGLPRFCKIDVEGFEEKVLEGLTMPIPFISFEFTKEFFYDAKKCIARLLSLGPATFNVALLNSTELLLPSWVEPDELYTKLDSIKDELLFGDIYVKFN